MDEKPYMDDCTHWRSLSTRVAVALDRSEGWRAAGRTPRERAGRPGPPCRGPDRGAAVTVRPGIRTRAGDAVEVGHAREVRTPPPDWLPDAATIGACIDVCVGGDRIATSTTTFTVRDWRHIARQDVYDRT